MPKLERRWASRVLSKTLYGEWVVMNSGRWVQRAERSYSTFKVRWGGHEEITLVQGKEQRLHFAGATMKRYPMSEVRET